MSQLGKEWRQCPPSLNPSQADGCGVAARVHPVRSLRAVEPDAPSAAREPVAGLRELERVCLAHERRTSEVEVVRVAPIIPVQHRRVVGQPEAWRVGVASARLPKEEDAEIAIVEGEAVIHGAKAAMQ